MESDDGADESHLESLLESLAEDEKGSEIEDRPKSIQRSRLQLAFELSDGPSSNNALAPRAVPSAAPKAMKRNHQSAVERFSVSCF